jgi:UDP-3-O-[3-hydroxymyristoyl] glucosamine N-acyltransferase
MIKINDLRKLDKSIEIKHSFDLFAIEGICPFDSPAENSFFFIKSNKYFKRIPQHSDNQQFLKTGIIIEKSFFETLDTSVFENIKNRYGFVATMDSFERAMCIFSKYFHDITKEKLNYFLDGRKLGSAQIDPNAELAEDVFVGDGVEIASGVKIHPGVKIMANSKIGQNTTIYPNTVIYSFVSIGSNNIIHASTTIGADGFGYNFFDGKHNKVWHYGGVQTGDDVEIGSSTCIDSGVFYPTRIGSGTKIDNLVQIAHNIEIGNAVIICGQTGMAGSSKVDDYCVFGAKSGLGSDIYIPKNVMVAANAQITGAKVYTEGSTLAGHPAREIKEWMKTQAFLRLEALKR